MSAPPANLPLHPRRGIHDPTAGSPARRPGSVRRTITIDALRPDGAGGSLRLVGRGRDLVTGADAAAEVAAEASVRFEIAPAGPREVLGVESEPAVPALRPLVGTSTVTGFRRRLVELAPDLGAAHPLLESLLDDVPVSSLVSGYALGRMGAAQPNGRFMLALADQCAGWARGATIVEAIERDGLPPTVTGPTAPSVHNPEDPLGWHEAPPLPPHGMRRLRRLDVLPGPTRGTCDLDVLFRDSYQSDGGPETVIHEYTVAARLDLATMTFTEIASVPRVLPWVECPLAAASAARLTGVAVADVRDVVRESLRGTSTCTHLNDTLRSLAGVPGLVAVMPGPTSARLA
ncbi:Protein of unknown function (DUF2889) [Frankia sp. EI5c]|uniref:DUF2889 domain-containing protein n=1 Tax=Frankia sp. EI5c TaxID=683316 RepID=UPI0007C38F4B|nr:DUF2889 domain-containing protein [Frankia sp. EI5c]OAA28146.1 Protein of unknown function (DUF2889) [Frankia sp. EI5c]